MNIVIDKNIKALRENDKLTLSNLAHHLKFNVNKVREYEFNSKIPPLDSLIKLSQYFNSTIDFLLLWNQTLYPHNLKLLSLAKTFDSQDRSTRYQIESTAGTFLNSIKKDTKVMLDQFNGELTTNIHENIKILREYFKIPQSDLATQLNIKQSVVSRYERTVTPPADKLIKLSQIFNISMHALATGQKLTFSFKDGHFGDTMLQADQLLSLEHQKFIIELMENILNQ